MVDVAPTLNDSILISLKAALGLGDTYDPFDFELVMHINGALAELSQLGVGPDAGYAITSDKETWSDLTGSEARLSNVFQYAYLHLRLIFDPPAQGFVVTAFERLRTESASRILMAVDDIKAEQERKECDDPDVDDRPRPAFL